MGITHTVTTVYRVLCVKLFAMTEALSYDLKLKKAEAEYDLLR